MTTKPNNLPAFFGATERYLLNILGPDWAKFLDSLSDIDDGDRLELYRQFLQCQTKAQLKKALVDWASDEDETVSPETFLLHPYYLGMAGQVYPEVLKEFCEINSGKYDEVVLTGAIGTAKTTLALWSTAYQLYLISKMKNPQQVFGLDRTSEIVFIFQSISGKKARDLDYGRFRELIERSPYFSERFPFDKDLKSELRFPNRIFVRPVTGDVTATIGENVFGGVIDEVNFMKIVENSKKSIDGGTFDQAKALYDSIAKRRKSRFMKGGNLPGLLCLVSSRRYPGQFTDRKEMEARTNPRIYVYDKRTWDIKPPGTFSGNWFWVYRGDFSHKPRILSDGEYETLPDSERDLCVRIPEEYRSDFESDIYSALRDVAGVATLAAHPYISNSDAIREAFGKTKSLLSLTSTDFVTSKPLAYPNHVQNREEPRFVHMDLSISGDSTGVVMGHVSRFVEVNGEILPEIVIDFSLEVRPPRGGEIEYWRIRELIYNLRDKLNIPIKWITFDSFQSVDNIHILRQKGFKTGRQSIDTSTAPYECLKNAIYTGRVLIPEHEKLQHELVTLEYDTKKNKVDHPPHSSKDISDSLAGVVYGLTMRREIWIRHGIPTRNIPRNILQDNVKRIEDAKNGEQRNGTE
jgi:hypothetical protein